MALPSTGIITSSLTAYTEQDSPLIRASVLGGHTLDYITIDQGIKYSKSINILGGTLVPTAYSCAVMSPTGSAVITQVPLTVCTLEVQESICLDYLTNYFTNKWLAPGADNGEKLPNQIESEFVALKMDQISAVVEDYIWKGSSSGTYSASLTVCNGILHTIELTSASASVIQAGTAFAGTNPTLANIATIVDDMFLKIPTDISDRGDLVLFMSIPNFSLYQLAIRDLYKYNANMYTSNTYRYESEIPGTGVKVVGTRGLNGTNRMVLTSGENIHFGTDLRNDFDSADKFKMFNDPYQKSLYFHAVWRQGIAIPFPQFVVEFK